MDTLSKYLLNDLQASEKTYKDALLPHSSEGRKGLLGVQHENEFATKADLAALGTTLSGRMNGIETNIIQSVSNTWQNSARPLSGSHSGEFVLLFLSD